MSILMFKNVFKSYRGNSALSDVSFKINKGEIVGVAGPNGAGKTTLIKSALGLIIPDSGKLEVNGYEPEKRENEFIKSVGFVSGQIQLLDPHVAVFDSIKVSGLFKSVDRDNIEDRITEFSQRLNIGNIMHKPARSLSLGERIKSEIIAGIIHQPQILFLDEPTIGLDFESQDEMHKLLKELNETLNITIIITSHYFEDIKSTCSRIIFLDDGRVVYDGDLQGNDTIHHPKLKKYLTKLNQ
jgi:ABC-2 type transport system ATP-binding protein